MPSRLRPIVLSAVEGAVLAAGAGAAACLWLGPAARWRAGVGLAAAWLASTASVAALSLTREGPPRGFMRAFGAGVALRAFVLVALMAAVWGGGWDEQAPVLSAYALGVLGLLTVEYRHLSVKAK